jgi:hypothetical protein
MDWRLRYLPYSSLCLSLAISLQGKVLLPELARNRLIKILPRANRKLFGSKGFERQGERISVPMPEANGRDYSDLCNQSSDKTVLAVNFPEALLIMSCRKLASGNAKIVCSRTSSSTTWFWMAGWACVPTCLFVVLVT